jgi:hypothetical protein
MRHVVMVALMLAGVAFSMTAAAVPLFPQCPAAGLNTGCQFLITINSGGSLSVAQDTNAPNNGPYDGSEDTMVGVVNNSGGPVSSITLSSSTDIFGFDDDGPCNALAPFATGCSSDPSGYGGPGVFFSGINTAGTAGTVVFTPPLANGASAWFGLEGALTASQIGTPAPPVVPAPTLSEWALILLGIMLVGGLAVGRRKA